ncbi:MAG: glycosyltransferase family 2 protein [Planctomycetes bacterium]|nr:glycosyltransferase family 2 protein [Planctomycetota bacterium]
MTAPVLSVVVLSWNTKELTLACLGALRADPTRQLREIIVIDNASHDGSADAIAEAYPEVVLVRNEENRGYSGGNNQGVRIAEGKFVCLLNSDTEVRPGALDQLVEFLEQHPGYGAVGPRLVSPDGSIQTACMRFPGLLTAIVFDTIWGKFPPGKWIQDRYFMRGFDHRSSRDVDQPPGACLVMHRAEYEQVGGLDEELWLFFNDVDLCRRLWRSGRRIRYFAEAEVMHHEGASTKSFAAFVTMWHRNRMAYYRKHYGDWVLPLLRLVVRWRAFEEKLAIKRRTKTDPGRRSAELGHLREVIGQIMEPLG